MKQEIILNDPHIFKKPLTIYVASTEWKWVAWSEELRVWEEDCFRDGAIQRLKDHLVALREFYDDGDNDSERSERNKKMAEKMREYIKRR